MSCGLSVSYGSDVEDLPVLEAIRIWTLSGCCHHVRRESAVPLRYSHNCVARLHDVFHTADVVRAKSRIARSSFHMRSTKPVGPRCVAEKKLTG